MLGTEWLSAAVAELAPLVAAHAEGLERERRMPTELVAWWRDAWNHELVATRGAWRCGSCARARFRAGGINRRARRSCRLEPAHRYQQRPLQRISARTGCADDLEHGARGDVCIGQLCADGSRRCRRGRLSRVWTVAVREWGPVCRLGVRKLRGGRWRTPSHSHRRQATAEPDVPTGRRRDGARHVAHGWNARDRQQPFHRAGRVCAARIRRSTC